MIISARAVRPRTFRRCVYCDGMIVTRAIRMYGHAEDGDPPYVVWSHVECVEPYANDAKIQKAIESARDEEERR